MAVSEDELGELAKVEDKEWGALVEEKTFQGRQTMKLGNVGINSHHNEVGWHRIISGK